MASTALLTIRQSTVAEFRERAGELMQAHSDEVVLHPDLMRLAPNWERFHDLESAGMLVVLLALEGDEVIGYSLVLLLRHHHYSDLFFAQSEAIYVTPSRRKSKIGLSLIRATEKVAKRDGAQLMLWHTRSGHKLDALLPSLGYEQHEVIYSRRLGGA